MTDQPSAATQEIRDAIRRAPSTARVNAILTEVGVDLRIHCSDYGAEWHLGNTNPGDVYEYGSFAQIKELAAASVEAVDTLPPRHGVPIAAIAAAMRELGVKDAVAAQWGDASGAISIVYAKGTSVHAARQVADYRHREWDAARELATDGSVNVYWDDEARCWCASVENWDDATRIATAA